MKQIRLQPCWKLPASYAELMANPPDGYRFLASGARVEAAVRGVGGLPFVRYVLLPKLHEAGVPINLFKSLSDRLRPAAGGARLTHAVNHLVLRPEPWVLDLGCELPAILAGPERRFHWYIGPVRRALESRYCRKIFTWLEAGRKSLLSAVGEGLAEKTEVVYWSVPPKRFTKGDSDGKVRLLFVGSVNFPGQFELKGGKEAVEAYLLLRESYDNLEMVVRSDMPPSFKARYGRIPGLRILDALMPPEELEREFQTADVFVQPGHVTPAMVFLEAMSYELPVVTTDVWGNGEIVSDGRTGFLVPKSRLAPDFEGGRLYARSRRFERVIRNVDPEMVRALAAKVSMLIEKPELRRRFGRAGRREIERGRFSVRRRNEKLKQVLDEATER